MAAEVWAGRVGSIITTNDDMSYDPVADWIERST